MKRVVLIYGLVGGVLVTLLQWSEYRFLVVEHSVEIYGALVAAVFSGLGIWLGLRLTRVRERVVVREVVVPDVRVQEVRVPAEAPVTVAGLLVRDEKKRDALGITRREMEILELMAEGLSNREIAERLFVSENTVKTHSSRVFDKLGAKRRTQAVQLGKQQGLLR